MLNFWHIRVKKTKQYKHPLSVLIPSFLPREQLKLPKICCNVILQHILGNFSCPPKFVNTFVQFHTNMKVGVCVNINGDLSEAILVNNWVKQGDISMPTLFYPSFLQWLLLTLWRTVSLRSKFDIPLLVNFLTCIYFIYK